MDLTIQEILKDLRVERGLTLEQLAEQTGISKSALGSYETDEYKDISHYALSKLADFYEVTADYILGRSKNRNHPNAELSELRLSDEMIELLKSGRIDNGLLCELAAHPDFPRLMADLEIYANGVAGKQVRSANALVAAARASVLARFELGDSDPHMRQLTAAHIDDDSYCRYVIQQDMDRIAQSLREKHKDDKNSIPEDNIKEYFIHEIDEMENFKGSRVERLLMIFCKQTHIKFHKLTEEEKVWLTRIAHKSDLLKSPQSQRGKKRK